MKTELYLGNFTTALNFIPDGTVDAFITDPPYPFEFIDCWYELGIFAEKKLKPGGWLVAYSGQKYLPDVLSRLAKSDLEYYSHRIFKFYKKARLDREMISLRNAVVNASIIVRAALRNSKSVGCHFIK